MNIDIERRSFQDLCCDYELRMRELEELDNRLLLVSENLSVLKKRRKILLEPKVDTIITRRLQSKYFLVRKIVMIDLRRKTRKYYHWEGWKYYSTPFDDDRDFAPVGIGIPEGGDSILGLGVLEREEPLDPFFVGLVKSLRRKIERLEKVLKSLRRKRSLLRREVEVIVKEVGKKVFGSNDLDEVEYEVAKSYIEEGLNRGVFDLQILMESKESSSDAKERLLDLIFGGVKKEEKEKEREEEMRVYIKDFDMSYKIVSSERGGWIIRDGKVFMLIDRSFVPQPGVYFYRGKVKRIIVDKKKEGNSYY